MSEATELEQRDVLVAELDVLRARLHAAAAGDTDPGPATEELAVATSVFDERRKEAGETPLDALCDMFGLSPFERSVLLLCAGPELVHAMGEEIAALTGRYSPTFGMALALLPDGHWSALTPARPLRRWLLVDLLDPSSPSRSPLAIDERILHHLVGAGALDQRLNGIVRAAPVARWLPPTLAGSADATSRTWSLGRVPWLVGPQPDNLRMVVASAAADHGHGMLEVDTSAVLDDAGRGPLLRLLERESALVRVAWTVDVGDLQDADAERVARVTAESSAPIALIGRQRAALPVAGVASVDVGRLGLAERHGVVAELLAEAEVRHDEAVVSKAASLFDLTVDGWHAVTDAARVGVPLLRACRDHARMSVGDLVTIRQPQHGWDDLVLPEFEKQQVQSLARTVEHRMKVMEEWGFGSRHRGIGTSALFAGPSGTGKTFAAEVIAGVLGVDLMHVDLSQVVNKYIGETEKHLSRVFDAAEDAGAVLLFDEADTLFGTRTQVRDSHDRYANLEVGYLLQRIETFRGLAILTTNAKTALDSAFVRRLHLVVTFPRPDASAQAELWKRALSTATLASDDVTTALRAIDLTGGEIHQLALGAAYSAADGPSIAEGDILAAAERSRPDGFRNVRRTLRRSHGALDER